MAYRPGETVPSHPDPPGARSRARRAGALGVAGARNAAGTSADVISAAAGDASALERAPPLVASSSVVPAASAAGRLDLELGGPQRCNADRVRGLLQKPMAPSGSRLLPLR